MGHVAGRHGEYGNLGDRAGVSPDAPAALVDACQVAVQVPRISAPARYLATRRCNLAYGVAVAGHVGHHDEHVASPLECQVLGNGQGQPGCEDPLDDRVVGGVQEEHQLTLGGPGLEAVANEVGVCMSDAHAGEHDGEGLVPGVSLSGDLHGEFQVRESADREDRQLLATYQGRQRVHDGDAGEDR